MTDHEAPDTTPAPLDEAAPSSTPGVAADAAAEDDLVTRLADAEARRDEYLDHYRRVAAEFDNYKKRIAREQQALFQRASERLVADLLPVLDDLERAVDAFADHSKEHVAEGVSLVHRALKTLLEKEGLVELDPSGEAFDPHRHEALLQQPSAAVEGTVIEVLQKGFVLGDRVIRPARVVIAAAKE